MNDGRGFPRYPWPVNMHNAQAALEMPSTASRARDPGVQWIRYPVAEPSPWRPVNDNISEQFRRYVMDPIVNGAANTEVTRSIQIDIPATLYGLTGAAMSTTSTDFAQGTTGLDHFTIRFEHSNGDRIDTQAAIASAMLGSIATGPGAALLGGPAWHFDRGSAVFAYITPLVANLRIDVVLWVMEYRGPANYNPLG